MTFSFFIPVLIRIKLMAAVTAIADSYDLMIKECLKKKNLPNEIREGPNQKPLTIKPYPMKIHRQYRQ